jgi:hypothetical protein
MSNSIWLEFADGQYLAHLKNKRIDAVETATGASFGDIWARSLTGTFLFDGKWDLSPSEAKWKNNELVEVVRQAFIGGGKAIIDGETVAIESYHVNRALSSYLDDRPRIELWKLAAAILHATMLGYESGEAEAPEKGANPKASSDQKATLDT